MNTSKKILIIGPSPDLANFNKEYILNHKSKDYTLFCYADVIKYFKKYNIEPDYFSFVDPNTIDNFYDLIKSGVCKNTSMITPDIYSNNLEGFFKANYTCNHLQKVGNYKRVLEMLSNITSYFKKNITKKYTLYENVPSILETSIDFKKTCILFRGDRVTNRCKLSYHILPLIFNHFPLIKEIKLIGFGHYDSPRILSPLQNNSKGYSEYKISYQILKPFLNKFLIDNNIKLHFDGAESYYKELST
tara:strand:+ start:4138 stop:4875 length:738 start_codon:yes stop_codon:yes gene_type:complete